MYDSNLDNQHKATQKFAKRWFGPYTMISANDNGTYHMAKLYGTRLEVSVAGKRIMAFKKQRKDEPELRSDGDDDEQLEADEGSESNEWT